MKQILLVTVLCFAGFNAFSQSGMYGADAGIGYGTAYKSKITPALAGYTLLRLSRSIYAGGELSFQHYAFTDHLNQGSNYGDIVNITQKSSYLFFCPKIDFGFGYRKYFHAVFSFGPGVFMGGRQATNQVAPFWVTNGTNYGYDTASVNTSYNLPTLVFKYTVGLTQRIPTHAFWNIIISEQFSYIPKHFSEQGPEIKTSYFSITVGVMHKFPMVEVAD